MHPLRTLTLFQRHSGALPFRHSCYFFPILTVLLENNWPIAYYLTVNMLIVKTGFLAFDPELGKCAVDKREATS